MDDLLHFAAGFVITLPAVACPFWVPPAVALIAGLLREGEQMYQALDTGLGPNRLRDVAGFVAGGLVVGLL